MLFKLAVRNVLRHRGRLIINTLTVIIASSLLVIAIGQIQGIKETLTNSVTQTLTGQIVVKPRRAPIDFFQFTSSKKIPIIPASDLPSLKRDMANLSYVSSVSERIRFGSLIGDDTRSTPAMVIAVDPSTEHTVCPDMGKIIGDSLDNSSAVISAALSRKTKLGVGDPIVSFSETPNDSFNAFEYKIVSEIDTPVLIDEFTNQLFIVSLDSARELLYLDGGATELVLRVPDDLSNKENLIEIRNNINELLSKKYPELAVYTYFEVESSIENISVISQGIGSIQVGTIIIVMLFVTLLLTIISLHERRYEIGTLMSIGMRPKTLTQMFLLEVGIKSVVGYVLGASLGIFVLLIINSMGGFKASQAVDQYIYGGKVMFPQVDYLTTFYGGLFIVGASLLVTFSACFRTSRQSLVNLLTSKQ